jgi:hypothetical protein
VARYPDGSQTSPAGAYRAVDLSFPGEVIGAGI